MKKSSILFAAIWISSLFVTACTPTQESSSTNEMNPTETLMAEATNTQPPVQIIKNIRYIDEAALDIYLPSATSQPVPAILAFHGGNDNRSRFFNLGYHLAERGYALVAIDYHDTIEYPYPQAPRDAFCALAWVQANASTYNFDTGNLFALGHSSGGTLAALLGTVDDATLYMEGCQNPLSSTERIKGVITFTGIFDFVRAAGYNTPLHDYLVDYLGGDPGSIPDVWTQASPGTWTDEGDCPFLLIHGGGDGSIPAQESVDFSATLDSFGVQVSLLIIPGADHMATIKHPDATQAIDEFLSGFGLIP